MALRNKEQEAAANALTQRFRFVRGSPWVTVPDNGLEFKNALARRISAAFNVKKRFTAPSHPQANGLRERINGVIANIIGKTQQGHLAAWGVRLPESAFLYSAKEIEAAGKTPYELLYGKPCTTFVDRALMRGDKNDADGDDGAAPPMTHQVELEAIRRFQEARKEVALSARLKQLKKDAKNKRDYDRRNRVDEVMVSPGDLALKRITQFTKDMHGKLGPRWEGPYVVTKVTRTTVHLSAAGKKPTTAPHANIKKYNSGDSAEASNRTVRGRENQQDAFSR